MAIATMSNSGSDRQPFILDARKMGSARSERKTKAARENGKLGGRPKRETQLLGLFMLKDNQSG